MSHSGERKLRALIVDDEPSICSTLAGVLSDEGWDSCYAYSGQEGIDLLRHQQLDLIFLDVWMKGLDGIKTLQLMKEVDARVPIVVMSGHATIETAVKATKLGASEFLEKPLSLEKILPLLEHARKVSHFPGGGHSFRGAQYELIGASPQIAAVHRQIKAIAPRNSWVLITGENGTGKEVVARNIHLNSIRVDKAFVAVNCAAIPEELIESELFGYERGAFTNAAASKRGRFELAHRGTLFLDEIGDMALATQAKILRILQEQTFERLGGDRTISIDVRVIAATNKDLTAEIAAGRFRKDLYYRLNVIPVSMPPLRERVEDVVVLAGYFLRGLAAELGEKEKTLTPDAVAALSHYDWPGNVRELKNLMERLCILVNEREIDAQRLVELGLPTPTVDGEALTPLSAECNLKNARNEFERQFIIEQLRRFDGNVSRTAEAIGLERSNLHRKLRAYDIDPKRGAGGGTSSRDPNPEG